jgi:curved DNA-binding protein CbpA
MELEKSYRVLGVRADADIPEVRTAFRRLAIQYHPDRNKSPEAAKTFAAITEAYDTIINSHTIAGGLRSVQSIRGEEEELDQERGTKAFSILTDEERTYRVSPVRFENEVRKHFNPNLASGIYCKVGDRWFEIDSETRSTRSLFHFGSGKGYGLIEWAKSPDNKDLRNPIKWDDFWSYVRRYASIDAPRQKNSSHQAS